MRDFWNLFRPRRNWSKKTKTAASLLIFLLLIALILSFTVLRPERIIVVEDETCQETLVDCQEELSRAHKDKSDLEEEVARLKTPPELTIEKWVRVDGDCDWQKEVSASKGDWLEMKIVVNVTKPVCVLVRDASLADDPWVRVENLEVNGEAFSGDGDIITGISLGSLTDTSQITFRVLLSNSKSNYSCGSNILKNTAEAGISYCEFQAAASVQVMLEISCSSSCCRPKPDPCPDGCPDPVPPPPPPEDDGGPAPRPNPKD